MDKIRKGITRRTALKAGAMATGGAALSTATLSGRMGAQAAIPPGQGRIVSVFLRGGMDGLGAVVPRQGPDAARMATLRPVPTAMKQNNIGIPPTQLLPIAGTDFGFHPNLTGLDALFTNNQLAVIHAVGHGNTDRSHFQAQDVVDLGAAGISDNHGGHGWITRWLTAPGAPTNDSDLRAIGIGSNSRSLAGLGAPAIPSLATFGLEPLMGTLTGELKILYHPANMQPWTVADEAGTAAINIFSQLEMLPGSTNPNSMHQMFEDAASMLNDPQLAVQGVAMNVGAWDLHSHYGAWDVDIAAKPGSMAAKLQALGDGLQYFQQLLDASGDTDVVTVVMTEFGRRLPLNGTGTDHGEGQVMFVMGNRTWGTGIAPGFFANWPTLAPPLANAPAGNPDNGDLAGTTDYRHVLGEIIDKVGGGNPQSVFEGLGNGFMYNPIGIIA